MTHTDSQLRELRDAIDAHLEGQPVEWLSPAGNWYIADQPISHYFEFVLRPKREPVTRPWQAPADVPMPICWVRRFGVNAAHLVYTVTHDGFDVSNVGRIKWDRHDDQASFEYSTTCRPDDWHPLTVEVKP